METSSPRDVSFGVGLVAPPERAPGYSCRQKRVWVVTHLIVASSKHKAEETCGSTNHTDCLSSPVLLLFEANKYITGPSTLMEKYSTSIHGAYGDFQKKLLACSSARLKELQT